MKSEQAQQAIDALIEAGFTPEDVSAASSLTIGGYENVARVVQDVMFCNQCSLQCGAPAVGAGSYNSPLMIVSDAPDGKYPEFSMAFTGAEGHVLTLILNKMNVDRSLVYLTHAVKCPLQAQPSPEDIVACRKHLLNEIALVRPKVILTIGELAMQSIRGDSSMTLQQGNQIVSSLEISTRHGVIPIECFHTYSLAGTLVKNEHQNAYKTVIWKDLGRAIQKASELAPHYDWSNKGGVQL